jgi:hypothetical protein
MLEAGPPPGLLICFLPVFCKGALGFWSLGTDNFITNGGGWIFFKKTIYVHVSRKNYFISLYVKTK